LILLQHIPLWRSCSSISWASTYRHYSLSNQCFVRRFI
jgi:hypothetical protein